ncbi:MAG: hypothetical protein LLF94_12250 [Chlamydiales bacterium]|nr:hypothetical protein [Chlamydiales bacterium]
MLGTVLSLIIAVIFGLQTYQTPAQPYFVSSFLLGISLLLLVIAFVIKTVSYTATLRTQNKVMGCAQELYLKDHKLHVPLYILFAFCLYSLYLTLTGPVLIPFICIWIVAFGFCFDALRCYQKRAFQYTSAPYLVKTLAYDLEKSVKNKDEAKAFEWLEVAIDACAKATREHQMRPASTALNAVQTLVETYVQEVSRADVQKSSLNGSGLTFLDKVNSLCMFVSERMMWVYEAALEQRVPPIAENIIAEFGKLSVFLARHNPLVASIAITYLQKCADSARNAGQNELLIRISITLTETIKQLLAYTRDRNESFRDLVMTSLATLEQVVKMIYRNNRDVNVVLLMQPFAEIGEFIGSDQMKAFPDRDEVLKQIRRVLTEFQALQVVTKNVETIAPHVAEDSTSSYQQDLPFTPST